MDKRTKLINNALKYIGVKKGTVQHKYIVDMYNSIKPLPYGYKLKYTDHWCAAFVSAMDHECGFDDLVPLTCSCSKYIEKAKSMGIWIENDAYVPQIGDRILYDWQDNGKGDNVGDPDHIGIVEKVDDRTMTIIEGNMSSKSVVGRRTISLNGKTIRGFVCPKFEVLKSDNKNIVEYKTIKLGSSGELVRILHAKLRTLHYGVTMVNDKFDSLTKQCVIHYQVTHNLEADGIVGPKTWASLLKEK